MQNNKPTPLTEEQLKDVNARIEKCAPEIQEVLNKHELTIGCQPAFNHSPMGSFITSQIGYADTKYAPKSEKKEEIIKENA